MGSATRASDYPKTLYSNGICKRHDVFWIIKEDPVRKVSLLPDSRSIGGDQAKAIGACSRVKQHPFEPGARNPMRVEYRVSVRISVFAVGQFPAVL